MTLREHFYVLDQKDIMSAFNANNLMRAFLMNMYLELKLLVVKSNRIHVLRSKQFRSKNCIDASVDNRAYRGI